MKTISSLTGAIVAAILLTPLLAGHLCNADENMPKDAETKVARPDDVEPAPTLEEFGELLSNSPFRRLLSLSDELVLSGVAQLPSGVVVTVVNRRTNETITVSEDENEHGWKLVGVSSGRDLADIQATIEVGRQTVMLKFMENRLTPRSRRRGSTPQPASQPERPSVEQWLARLDPALLSTLDELAETRKERFKYEFENYLERYPEASSELRLGFAREKFETLLEQEDAERQGQDKLIKDLEPPPEKP